eukprot:1335694-Alexandrium_andersonii.AAC.1
MAPIVVVLGSPLVRLRRLVAAPVGVVLGLSLSGLFVLVVLVRAVPVVAVAPFVVAPVALVVLVVALVSDRLQVGLAAETALVAVWEAVRLLARVAAVASCLGGRLVHDAVEPGPRHALRLQ